MQEVNSTCIEPDLAKLSHKEPFLAKLEPDGAKLKPEKVINTTYSWNIMCQKREGDCGLWVLNEIILKEYAESLKKIVGAV